VDEVKPVEVQKSEPK